MSSERYEALGLATARAAWFNDVARWATVGSAPIEFIKCISVDEMMARLSGGRSYSILLVDAGTNAVDRDLLDLASQHNVPLTVVDDGRTVRDWSTLGVAAVLPPTFSREQLLDSLARTSAMIGDANSLPPQIGESERSAQSTGRLVGVTGSGGTGASTVAIALAQALAQESEVLLADLCLHGDLAMLHDARDIVPGVQELVDAYRAGRPTKADLLGLTFAEESRGYHLLLGLRRHRDWTALRPRAFEAALDGLTDTFGYVVANTDADTEGEAESGSIEVEERNLMARTVCRQADLLVVVGQPGVKGSHALVRTVNCLREFGVNPTRMVAVFNGASRNPRVRAELTRSFADLTGATAGLPPVVGPLFLGQRRSLEEAHRDAVPFPANWCAQLAKSVQAINQRSAPVLSITRQPLRIQAGSLGVWSDAEAAGQ